MQILINITKDRYDFLKKYPEGHSIADTQCRHTIINGIVLDDMTNSEVIGVLFPQGIKCDKTTAHAIKESIEWWNSPYELP